MNTPPAIVLAAGKGTRLGRLTAELPKPLVPLRGRPMLSYVLDGLASAGVRQAALITGYREDKVRAFVHHWHADEGRPPRLSCFTQAEQLGTGHALLQVPAAWQTHPVVVTFGDILVRPVEYQRLIEMHGRWPSDSLLALYAIGDPWEGAAVYLDGESRVERIVEKPPRGTSTTPYTNVGLFLLQPEVFEILAETAPSERGEIELTSALDVLAAAGRLRAFAIEETFVDVGTPARLAFAERWLGP